MRPSGQSILLILGATALLCLLVWSAVHWKAKMERGLPPRVECVSQAEALNLATLQKGAGPLFSVVGTGSMAPYLPAAQVGQDPATTIVAYAIAVHAKGYADIVAGDLCVYTAPWNPALIVMHQAAVKDAQGWIMAGLHNAHYESQWRVTPANFRAIVARTYVWSQ